MRSSGIQSVRAALAAGLLLLNHCRSAPKLESHAAEAVIQHDCGRSVRTLPTCAPESNGLTPSALVALARGFEGTRVSVRGDLVLTPVLWHDFSSITCGPFRGPADPIVERGGGGDHFCCPAAGDAPVLVSNGEENLILDGSWCNGDSSRTCCSLPVFGQAVIARGVLAWRESTATFREGWVLKDPELCEVKPAPPFTALTAPSWPPLSTPLR